MTVIHEKQTIIECDYCSRMFIEADYETYVIKDARDEGWIIRRDKTAICPSCQGVLKE